jgi:renalase
MSIAIIGAGICGLTLANKLSEESIDNFILEKSKGVGGRLATRRDGEATYDHGAAFYLQSNFEPNIWHERWQNAGLTKLWFSENERLHFCGASGMTSLAKDLAQNVKVYFSEKVVKLDVSQNSVSVLCESNKFFEAQKIVLTSPLPQVLEILNASQINYPADLNNIVFGKALVGLFEIEDENKIEYNFNILKPNSNIFTLANNQAKRISKKFALSVVMSGSWSDQHFKFDDTQILALMQIEMQKYFKFEMHVIKAQLKKWRYAQPRTVYKDKHVSLNSGQIILAGDAFGGGSIAGALRSAQSAFEFINKPI